MDEEEKKEFERLKAEIEQIRVDYNSAKGILKKVTDLGSHFEELRGLLDDEEKGVQKNYDWVKGKKDEIDILNEQSRIALDAITGNLQKVEANIESMQTAYSEFTEIKGKISGVSGEIETLLSTARSLQKDILTTKESSLEVLESIKETFEGVTEKIKDMQTAYQEFLQIRSKIEDKDGGLEAIFNSVQAINKKSTTLFKEIQTFRDDASAHVKAISENKTQSESIKNQIKENYDFSEKKKKEIAEATGLIIDVSFAETFKRRQDEIEKGLYSWYSWRNIFLASVILLVAVVILPFTPWVDFGKLAGVELFFNRIFYTSPLLFLIAFSSIQYSKERDLAEKYAFKAASSAAIRSHIDYLKQQFPVDDEKKILSFSKATFETIYKEPYKTHDSLKEKIKLLEKQLKNEQKREIVDVDQLVASAKELRELFKDETLLQKVVNLLYRKY